MSEKLTLQEAADRLGVHYMTAYRYVRLGKLPATKDGTAWVIDEGDLDAVGSPSAEPPRSRDTNWAERLESRLLAGDEAAAWSVVEAALGSGHTPRAVYEEMIVPAMRRIGAAWADGRIDIADEHMATLSVLRIVGRLSPRFNRRGRTKGAIIVATAPNDHHALAAMMLGDLFREAGYHSVDLGAAVPAASLGRVASTTERLIGVALSASRPDNEDAIREAIVAVHEAGTTVLLGGTAIEDREHALRLGADGWADSATAALEAFGLMDHNTPRP